MKQKAFYSLLLLRYLVPGTRYLVSGTRYCTIPVIGTTWALQSYCIGPMVQGHTVGPTWYLPHWHRKETTWYYVAEIQRGMSQEACMLYASFRNGNNMVIWPYLCESTGKPYSTRLPLPYCFELGTYYGFVPWRHWILSVYLLYCIEFCWSLIYAYTHPSIGISHIFLATQLRDSFFNLCWYKSLCRRSFLTWRKKRAHPQSSPNLK